MADKVPGWLGPPMAGRGFTLLEVLMVLLIIGITVSFIGLSVNTRADRVEQEARRLALLINLAQEEAVLNGREYAVEFNENGYTFLYLTGSGWERLEDDDTLRQRRLPAGVELQLILDGEAVAIHIREEEVQPAAEGPRLFILSSGEVTDFRIILKDAYSELTLQIVADARGRGTVAPLDSGG